MYTYINRKEYQNKVMEKIIIPLLLTFFFSRSHLAWVQEEWNSRKSWWPSFHFSYFWAKSNWKDDKTLACEKALVAGLLLGKGTCFVFFLSSHSF